MTPVDGRIANLDGSSALPRKNGELVFKAPWEGRIFGMAVALHDKGTYPWNAFRSELIEQIASRSGEYYENWLDAFESLLLNAGVIDAAELQQRVAEFKSLQRDPIF